MTKNRPRGIDGEELLAWLLSKCRPAKSGCLEWTGATMGAVPYGCLRYRGKLWYAHRLSAFLAGKLTYLTKHVLHSCDNPLCCNPDHLREGTTFENMADKELRGRANRARGSSHGMAKLTEADVLAIRCDPRTQTAIAKAFGVSQSLVSTIKRGETWRSVPPASANKE